MIDLNLITSLCQIYSRLYEFQKPIVAYLRCETKVGEHGYNKKTPRNALTLVWMNLISLSQLVSSGQN